MDQNTVEIRKCLSRVDALQNDEDFQRKFEELRDLMHDIAVIKGWWEPAKSVGEQIVMMHSELSEAIEEYRKPTSLKINEKMNAVYVDYSHSAKPEGIPIELADLLIRLLDTCAFYHIDLLDALLMKAQFNLTREHRHGAKTI